MSGPGGPDLSACARRVGRAAMPVALAAALAAPGAALARAAGPFDAMPLYLEHGSAAAAEAEARAGGDPEGAAALLRIAATPQALWLGGGTDVRRVVAARVAAARRAHALPLLVLYAVPGRNCGGYSDGGLRGLRAYRLWIERVARGVGRAPAAIVLEPDALAEMDCLPPTARALRVRAIAAAVTRLGRLPRTAVYVDAGHAGWVRPPEMARRLRLVGVRAGRRAGARGFAVNVANFRSTAESRRYGRRISRLLGGVPFVIDTSRNGAGPPADQAWCNPPGRALGAAPTARTGDPLVDALLWVKRPGESDGECAGGPPAGVFWPDYAIGLARAAG